MEIQTYEVLSLDVDKNGNVFNEEVSGEALALIETLGLEGQKILIQRLDVATESTERIMPYRVMTAEEQAIFATLFSVKTPIASYKHEPIPLRVLQVAAHATQFELKMYILHPKIDAYVVDPILVGEREEQIGNSVYKTTTTYILARWGQALATLEELRKQALPKVTASIRTSASMAAKKYSAVAENAEEIAEKFLNGEDTASDLPDWQVRIHMPTFTAGR